MGALAGIFVAAVILGSFTISYDVFAQGGPPGDTGPPDDPGPQGGPIAELQSQVDENTAAVDSFFDVFTEVARLFNVDSFFDVFVDLQNTDESLQDQLDREVTARQDADETLQAQVDSFFDVFFDVETPRDACPEGKEHKYNSDLKQWECLPDEFVVDSFFDVFFDITVDTQKNTEDIDTIQTEILSLDLRGQSCSPGNALVGVDANGELVCEPVCTPENSELSCTDGIDNDCDGLTDCDDSTCQSADLGATCSLPPVDCDDGNVCTVDFVGPDGTCVNDATAANGNSCDDGLFCTSEDSCNEGVCTAGVPTDCRDGICDEASNMCIFPTSCSLTEPRLACGELHCVPDGEGSSVCSGTTGTGLQGIPCNSNDECFSGFACVNTGDISQCLAWCQNDSQCSGGTICQSTTPTTIVDGEEFGICF